MFVGVAISACFIVRPLVAIAGWPLQRVADVVGSLARDERAVLRPSPGQRRAAQSATNVINGFDGASDVYDFDWLDGSDADIAKLAATPGSAIGDAQFAKQHGVAVGERFELQTPSGRRATFTALATCRGRLSSIRR